MGEKKKILWAPWRIEYIEDMDKDNTSGCIFCEKPGENEDTKNLIVFRGRQAFVIMNRYPYNNGHLMVVPFQHTCELSGLNDKEKLEIFDLLALSQKVLTDTLKPQGFNIGMNLGRLAGAGIDSHLHFHLVPRWGGDTNFMPVLGHTRVISEALEETCSKLSLGFSRLIKSQEEYDE